MKLLIATLCISLNCLCQEIKLPVVDSAITYSEVIQADSLNAADLYSRSKIFITSAFVSAKDVTQLTDDNTKTVIAKGIIPVELRKSLTPFDGKVRFTLTIQCKEGRYKYSFSEFIMRYRMGTAMPYRDEAFEHDDPKNLNSKQWNSIKEQVDLSVKAMISDMKQQMNKKPNDW